ncbi:hypothetical protein [Geotalea sp. SG265]|uniref:hypothetical protein n=1 Tax=Geotalea sp. SG265 TaxID=2922867 RepID=UPI001FAEAB38|nr:hypothetical protein [Geotalea sp. SG265]
MRTYLSFFLVVLCFTAITAGPASAARAGKVYLNDGAVIECQKVWRSGGKVMVRVNRDVLLDFSPAEVDLKKTFAKKGVVAKGKKKHLRQAPKRKIAHTTFTPVQKPVSSAKIAAPAKPAAVAKTGITPPAKGAPAPNAAAEKNAVKGGAPAPATPPPAPAAAAKQAAPSSAKGNVAASQLPKPAPRPAVKYVPPPPPPPEPFYKNPLVVQAGGGGLLIVLLLVLLVMKRKKA